MRADVHSHLVPGVDDGARDLDEALAAVERLAADGVRRIVTTPHLDASALARPAFFERDAAAVEAAFGDLVAACGERRPDVTLGLGREVLLDVPAPDLAPAHVRLNGGRYVLVEFPRLMVPAGSGEALRRIREQGYTPILAHVERYAYDRGSEREVLEGWKAAGALLQVNAASALGKYGPEARRILWDLLGLGWADLAASDYHARGRTWLGAAREEVVRRGGAEQAELLFDVNPMRVCEDERLEFPAPLPRPKRRWLSWPRKRPVSW